MKLVDVTVIGGGRAGCAAAIALSAAGRSVAVLERTHYERARVGEILPPAAKPALCALGVWDRFQDSGFTPSPGIVSAWGQAQPYANDYITNPYGSGWHIDPSRFDRMLADAARSAGATVHTGAGAASCRRTGDGWLTMARAGDQQLCLRSDFVIDATGRRSWLARRLGQRRLVYDRLVAVVGVIDRAEEEQTRDRRTLIESGRDGWWYSADLSKTRGVCVYMTDADLLGARRCPKDQWRRSAPLTRARSGPTIDDVDLRIVSAATSRLATVTDGARWLAVGDAAVACDPLWGQGIVSALASGRSAAQALTGRPEALAEFATADQRRFNDYLRLRAYYYRRENRWPHSVFWARRRDGHAQQTQFAMQDSTT
jgi:flavin-dependent dehydrogenase